MVQPVNGANNGKAPEGYNKVTLYDEKTKKTETYLVPVGKKINVNGKTYDPGQFKNNEITFKGTKKPDTKFNLMGLALERMDVNDDGKIDINDTDPNMSQKINKDLEKQKSEYYVKYNDIYSDAGISKGSGGVVFSKGEFGEEKSDIFIE